MENKPAHLKNITCVQNNPHTKTNNMVNTVEFLSDHMPEQTHMVCFKFLLHLEFAFDLC